VAASYDLPVKIKVPGESSHFVTLFMYRWPLLSMVNWDGSKPPLSREFPPIRNNVNSMINKTCIFCPHNYFIALGSFLHLY
jgi:hypothetical protein